MGINQTPSSDYVERGKSSSLASSGEGGSEGAGDGDVTNVADDGQVLPYNVRVSQRGGGQVLLPPPPPTASPMRKPPLSPAKTRGAVTIPKTPPSDFSSLSASTYTTIGTRSGTALRGVEYAELPGDRSPASGGGVLSIPGLGVDGFQAAETKQPRTPLSRKRNVNGHSPYGGWFNKLTSKMRGGVHKSDTAGSYGSIDDPKRSKEAKRYHDKNQAFLKRTERHRKMQRSGNVEQVAAMAAGSNHSRNHSRGFSGALDSIASISSEEEITDDEERSAGVNTGAHQSRPLVAESKEEEYLRRIRDLEYENRRLLRVQVMETEVQGYNDGYGTLPTAIPVTVRAKTSDGLMMNNGDGATKARVAIVAVIIILLAIVLIYGVILCVLFLL